MNKESIFFIISVAFLISIVIIIFNFTFFYISISNTKTQFEHEELINVIRMFKRYYKHGQSIERVKEDLFERGFIIIKDLKKINEIVINSSVKNKILDSTKKHGYVREHRKYKRRIKNRFSFFHVINNSINYLYITTNTQKILLKQIKKREYESRIIIFLFLLVIFSIIFLYLLIIKKLRPLKILTNKVEYFGDENFDIECATSKKDEISQLSNVFDESAKKLKRVKEARTIFLRNIMHELKTPITKGKFLINLPYTKQNNETMQKVFYRLEALIKEFATIEELISTKRDIELKNYSMTDIIDNSVDMLLCDSKSVKQINNERFNVDFKLFSIVVKNLLDNALKYSQDKKVVVIIKKNCLIFQNKGEPLKYLLKYYYEPFFREDKVKSNQSFGLGLYIVKHILDAHNFTLQYEHLNGLNQFTIYIKK